ncbi:MFS general substrate transporter, partial [Suhomyces tanzawaensis NRRL Y-17324]
NYTPVNLVAFCLAGFACVSVVVFLASTQPFYITEVIGLQQDNIGSVIGTLGAVDELTLIVTAPLLGALADKLNGLWWFHMSGSKFVQSSSLLVVAIALVGYGQWCTSIVPDLVFFRAVFAIGVTACMSMITVTLNELSNSDFDFAKFWRRSDQYQVVENGELATSPKSKNGKYAAMVGMATGMGAIFAVSFFLTLPPKLVDRYPNLDIKGALKLSYDLIAAYAVLMGLLLFLFLYDFKKSVPEVVQVPDGTVEEEHTAATPRNEAYFALIYNALVESKKDRQIQLAYVGAFVARSTTVTTSVFIPLLVYNYYYNTGKCGNSATDNSPDFPSKATCHDGYIFSAILTGVAQSVALVSSPLWGWLIDLRKVGKQKTILMASITGILGNFGLCLLSTYTPDGVYDPRTSVCFVMVSFIGLSQIGIIITSMSILSGVNKAPHMGSLSGLYSLCGGLGILVISKVGGVWSDSWILAPFFLLGTFNLVLMVV